MICAVILEHDSIVLLECNGGCRFRSDQSGLYLFFHYPEDIMCSICTKNRSISLPSIKIDFIYVLFSMLISIPQTTIIHNG